MIDFDKSIKIKCWKTEKTIATVDACQGLKMMGCSHRFDSHHTTAAVRVLDSPHALELRVGREDPVTFEQ